jgi:CRP/FNR family cyclic AMP-dependent transcriptional regulator
MHTLEPIIREHPFFRDLEERHIKLVTGCAKNVRFNEGELLFREGDPANWFYLIRHGQAAVEINVPGRGAAILETVGEGDVLGWSWLFPPYRWHFEARALQLVRALAFDGKCLRGKCEKDHDLGYELMKRTAGVVIDRLQAARMQLLDLYGVRA